MMRKLLWGCAVLAVLWCGYWMAATFAIRTGVVQALQDAAQQRGFQAPAVAVAGFPTAFDIRLTGLDISDPATGVRWQSPGLQLQAQAWRPWQVNILPDPTQTITLPDQTLSLTATDLRGALTVRPTRSLDLQHATATIVQPVLTSTQGWGASADLAEVKLAASQTVACAYDIAMVADNLRPDAALAQLLGNATPLSRVVLDATVLLSDRLAPATDPATLHLLSVQVGRLTAVWGDVQFDLSGQVFANADGLAEGRFDIVLRNWRSVIPALVAAGVIKANVAPTVTGFLNAMAAQGGDPDLLVVPLIFANGLGTLGPVPLGPAPRLMPVAADGT